MGVTLFYAPLSNAAVYKIVDEQTGRVTFTDNPQKYEKQAGKKISQMTIVAPVHNNSSANANNNTSSSQTQANSATNSSTSVSTNSSTAPAQPSTISPNVRYQLTLIEPSTERAYRRPAQSIDVQVQLKPALQAGDIITIYLDGNQVAQGLSASIATVDLLPGAHIIKVMISNEKGQSLAQVSRTVYVIQNTAILQNNKKIAQQLLAYEQLPWHQKILLKLRQDNIQLNPPSKPTADTPMTLEQPVVK
ncbi:DUF4124 domain-containing protein [Psychrobacter sp. 16-MNA-CIBAN-0192]|uniref:DUF4124 domain-containing protein n=1 Tax=Psychrobacter sp. 16-MNA-CIBAN-0192 TaxID=3140448 RepID=UPI003318E934